MRPSFGVGVATIAAGALMMPGAAPELVSQTNTIQESLASYELPLPVPNTATNVLGSLAVNPCQSLALKLEYDLQCSEAANPVTDAQPVASTATAQELFDRPTPTAASGSIETPATTNVAPATIAATTPPPTAAVQTPTSSEYGTYTVDLTTTDTADWSCIRQDEGSNPSGNYTQVSGAYGILTSSWRALPSMGFTEGAHYAYPGAAPAGVQNDAARFLLEKNGDVFRGTWNDGCTESGRLR